MKTMSCLMAVLGLASTFASADLTKKAGQMVDKADHKAAGTTDATANKVNDKITSVGGSNAVTKTATDKVKTQSGQVKEKSHQGATQVKKSFGDVSASHDAAQSKAMEAAKNAEQAAQNTGH